MIRMMISASPSSEAIYLTRARVLIHGALTFLTSTGVKMLDN